MARGIDHIYNLATDSHSPHCTQEEAEDERMRGEEAADNARTPRARRVSHVPMYMAPARRRPPVYMPLSPTLSSALLRTRGCSHLAQPADTQRS